jgi:hypothetical protein
MNTNNPNTNDRDEKKQNDQNRNDDQFWTNWWREYAQTWK